MLLEKRSQFCCFLIEQKTWQIHCARLRQSVNFVIRNPSQSNQTFFLSYCVFVSY